MRLKASIPHINNLDIITLDGVKYIRFEKIMDVLDAIDKLLSSDNEIKIGYVPLCKKEEKKWRK